MKCRLSIVLVCATFAVNIATPVSSRVPVEETYDYNGLLTLVTELECKVLIHRRKS
jgi:hypothetical protein